MTNKYVPFSERNNIVPPKPIQTTSLNGRLRNSLWNSFLTSFLVPRAHSRYQLENKIYKPIWVHFLCNPIDEYKPHKKNFVKIIFLSENWYLVFDIIEFCLRVKRISTLEQARFSRLCNIALEKENSAYRIIGDLVTEITSEGEMVSVEKAMNAPFESVKEHIYQATASLYDRDKPDHRNSIKESICAVESLAKEVLNSEEGTLGQLVKNLDLHPALKDSLSKLYGFTSDADGVRHGGKGEPMSVDKSTAQFILVTCSAFVNYIISTHSK